jgi:hypothetical protein
MEMTALIIAVLLVVVLGAWVLYLKRQIADLTDQVAVLEAEREKRHGGARAQPAGAADSRKAGIHTYELE